MSIREKLKKNDPISSGQNNNAKLATPAWVTKGTPATKTLFKVSHEQYEIIKNDIENGKILQPKNQWLARSSIATKAGYDRSLINPRRQPDLCSWLELKNEELNDLFEIKKPKTRTIKQKTKQDLKKEITKLRKKHNELLESDRRQIIESYFNSNMLDDRDSLRIQNQKLKIENEDLLDKNARLKRLSQQNENIIAQLMQSLTAEQRAKLSWKT